MADDETSLRDSLVDILDLAGYEVLSAADGEEALQVLDQESVDLLLLDMAMPKVDGLAVLEALRPPPKVIVLSAFAYYGPEDIETRGFGGKVSRTLQKPCAPAVLLAAVEQALDQPTGID